MGGLELVVGERHEDHELHDEHGGGIGVAEGQAAVELATLPALNQHRDEDGLLHGDQQEAEVVGPEEGGRDEDVARPVAEAGAADHPKLCEESQHPEEGHERVHPHFLRVPDQQW